LQNVVAVEGRGTISTNDYTVTALVDDGSFSLRYLPTNRPLTVDLTKLTSGLVNAAWFNPRNGEATRIGDFTEKNHHTFDPPGYGDWVLTLNRFSN
jgi:hypothetical protein